MYRVETATGVRLPTTDDKDRAFKAAEVYWLGLGRHVIVYKDGSIYCEYEA